jgi:hypothetical protein
MCGDPFQLPPVVTDNMKTEFSKLANRELTEDDFYFFQSPLFGQRTKNNEMDFFSLETYYRQDNKAFIDTLQRIATGSPLPLDFECVNSRINYNFEGCPVVTTRRVDAKNFTNYYLEIKKWPFMIHNPFNKVLYHGFADIAKDYPDFDEPILYAMSAPIIFTKNEEKLNIVNGQRGVITAISPFDNVQIQTDRNTIVFCRPTTFQINRLVFDPKRYQVVDECAAMIDKLPFILGFSMTVHRCQGITLDNMIFNPGLGCFAPGQLYVALSRVRNLQNLVLHMPMRIKDIIVSKAVLGYYDFFSGKCTKVQDPYIPN